MNLNTATTVLDAYIDKDIPVFLWGAPGIGKSSIIAQNTNKRGWKLIDFRASTRDPVALMGLPDLSEETTRWKVPDEFPQVDRDGPNGILFLDELNVAPPLMQAAMFGLVLDRRVGEYTLPPGWRVIAAGNRQSDKAAAQRMPSALANRFAHIDVEADLDTLVAYLNEREVNPKLVAFLRFRPQLVHSMGGADARAFPTPRSWEQVAKVIDVDDTIRLHLTSGLVGEGPAAELEAFLRVYLSLPTIEAIFKDPESTKTPTEPAAKFAVAAALAARVTIDTFAAGMTYMRRIDREFEIMFTIDAVRRDTAKRLVQTRTFIDFATRNTNVMVG